MRSLKKLVVRCTLSSALLFGLCACGGGGGGGDGGTGTPAPGEVVIEPVTGMRFAWVPAGSFTMGDIQNAGFPDEKPVHTVTFATGFWMGTYEVTQAQWFALMGSNPSWFSGDTRPVESVTWADARAFVTEFNAATGASCRLPTEAEWEYAARAGGTTLLYAGTSDPASLTSYAWFADNASDVTHPVGGKFPNALNLYDMSGNVWEWVEDDVHTTYTGAPVDGSAWVGSPRAPDRILRGGSYFNAGVYQRTAMRGSAWTDTVSDDIGFRLVCDP